MVPERAGLPADRAITFGPFRLFPERKLLLEGEQHVRVGSRALDILIALVEQAGTLVRKEGLIARAWPDTFVDAANLRIHIAALRKALGDGQDGNRYLVTDPGRGYRFVAPVRQCRRHRVSRSGRRRATRCLPACQAFFRR
jgi:DNA-binding winged helix-turn-helix (wHTH) protein